MSRRGTGERGYGYVHKQLRKQALDAFEPGQPCVRCRAPIWGGPVDLDHTDDRTSYRGLAHRHCNRAAGARKLNAMKQRPKTSRRW